MKRLFCLLIVIAPFFSHSQVQLRLINASDTAISVHFTSPAKVVNLLAHDTSNLIMLPYFTLPQPYYLFAQGDRQIWSDARPRDRRHATTGSYQLIYAYDPGKRSWSCTIASIPR